MTGCAGHVMQTQGSSWPCSKIMCDYGDCDAQGHEVVHHHRVAAHLEVEEARSEAWPSGKGAKFLSVLCEPGIPGEKSLAAWKSVALPPTSHDALFTPFGSVRVTLLRRSG